ncbi:imidazole glycerol phosphate synthase subunit HisH [Hasllibacter halocynthiae]|uniref:Imidazole glycerol phosphate synthase subunit HisH n=1 Tax=Hasllibacter halocynthiae TaxID=595589 RepID=A0A2T0X788_9RHOB|nr:imidazole glycerol phosphate synthase subunit HisH [Hasllibacter halocynthiae]PRY94808.1 imidazole glycerol phosphate synthase subunit HisH [Hasllibacter halocynthiae]
MSGRCVLVDAGMGNLHSAEKAFRRMAPEGSEIVVTGDPDAVRRADRLVLPGDGAFRWCMGRLGASGLREAVEEVARERPFLGICVGMQMMARRGFEHGETPGLGWIAGEVRRIDAGGRPVPHMGWNDLSVLRPHPVLEGIGSGAHAYFVHGWQMEMLDEGQLLATADYGGPVTAVVAEGNRLGTQFHPEKSQEAGLRLIANFLRWDP